ncbi:mino acid transporter [Diaporthe amygdali]|uniref:mino acid transporter n=1 Tax=Phomopsis amygdali TaxID=1214568 RepID=UPI0022FED406|nr:mino acid transporter [Diaporthe amygdali]KAJ0125370.1 mino acid transporter [Diaporthe amygdali]
MSGSSAQFCTYHAESEPGVVEGVDSSIAVRSIWPRKCIGTAIPPEPYIPRGRVAANAYADPLSTLTDAEKKEYIDAELCLQSAAPRSGIENAQTRWDELHYIHIAQTNMVHDVGAFLPWHRLYMRVHELLLQSECNYTGAQPYWDEQADYVAIEAGSMTLADSVVFDPDTGFGGNGTGTDECVADGPFTDLELHINQTGYAVDYCLSRDLSESNFLRQANTSYVDTCFASANYSEAWQCYKSNPHGAGHSGVGGVMFDVTLSPGDPLFYLHHTFLDYLWWQWQAVDLSTRLTDMTGRNVPEVAYLLVDEDYIFPISVLLEDNGDPGNVTTLNHNLWMAGLVPNATISEVMDIRGDLICADRFPYNIISKSKTSRTKTKSLELPIFRKKKMPSTTTKKMPASQDDIIIARPKKVYTGERRRSHDASSSAASEFDIVKHRRSLSLACAELRDKDGKLKTRVEDWMPKPLADGTYGSELMQDLCEDFAQLAADLVKGGFPEGK